MVHSRLIAAIGLSIAVSSTAIQAETQTNTPNPRLKYNEPTRGFFIEHGLVNGVGKASVELHNGADLGTGGSVRLGLPKAELIINNNLGLPAGNETGLANSGNEVLVKWKMPALNRESSTPIQWALVGGVGYQDIESDAGDSEQTTIKLGAAATVSADAGMFTLAPKLVISDSDDVGGRDDTFLNVDIGAYAGLVDTQVGLFSVGVEGIITTEDDVDNLFSLGMRWSYNKHLTLDVVPVTLSETDLLGVPGLVRINATF